MTITIDKCGDLIKEFLSLQTRKNIKDICKEDIDLLKDFNFYLLWDTKTYGEEYNEYRNKAGHEDNFPLAKFIYMFLWGEYAKNDLDYILPELYNALDVNCLYNEQNYSSDTMNPIKNSKYYLTIGNFMLLPKNNYEKYYFNKYRYQKYKDNFISFLKKMKYLFTNKEKILKSQKPQDVWENLLIANKIYFNKIESFDKFLSLNFLNKYKQYLDLENEFYSDIKRVEGIIQNRANAICDKLKSKLF